MLLSEESSVVHACFFVVSDSESDSESSEDGEKFLTIWANDSLIGELVGEGGKGDSSDIRSHDVLDKRCRFSVVNWVEAVFLVVFRFEFNHVFLIFHVLLNFDYSIQFDLENFKVIRK